MANPTLGWNRLHYANYNNYRASVMVVRETEKAVLLRNIKNRAEAWFPKQALSLSDRDSDAGTIYEADVLLSKITFEQEQVLGR